MTDPPVVVVADLPQLQRTFATEFINAARAALDSRGSFVVALPGGSVAPTFFPVLATLAVDWGRVDIFWIDERAVPPDHPDSNYGLASRLLLQPVGVPSSRVHRMQGELADLDEAARRAADELKLAAGDPPRLDLAIVGVGEDGHVASVFGGGPGFESGVQPVVAIHDAPKPPARRLTMTLPVLAGARRIIVAAVGPSKAHVIHDALDRDVVDTPVAELLRRASSSIVLLDRRHSH